MNAKNISIKDIDCINKHSKNLSIWTWNTLC